MRDYLVTTEYGQYIILAKDAKDAIDIAYDKESKEHLILKSEIKARSLGSLHNKEGKIINVN